MIKQVHDAIKNLADSEGMTIDEYLYAIQGGGFPCDCKERTPALKDVITYDDDHYCVKCGNYYHPAMADPRFVKKVLNK